MGRADGQPRRRPGRPCPAHDRPIEAIAAEIIHATPEQDEGDGWLGGVREYIPDADGIQ